MKNLRWRAQLEKVRGECGRRLEGCWDWPEWIKPILLTFGIQTTIRFALIALYLLRLDTRLPFTLPSLGRPYEMSDIAVFFAVPTAYLITRLIGLIVVAPLVEELRFRGTVWVIFIFSENRWLHWASILCAAMLWSFLHGRALLGTTEVFTAGIFTGWLVLKTKNIVPPILFHALWNLVVVITSMFGIV